MLSLSCGMQDLSLGCVDFSLAVVCKVRAWGLIASVQSVLRPPNSPSQKKIHLPAVGMPLVGEGSPCT